MSLGNMKDADELEKEGMNVEFVQEIVDDLIARVEEYWLPDLIEVRYIMDNLKDLYPRRE